MINFRKVFSMVLWASVALTTISLSSCKKEGCRDPEALNYDADAQKECDHCCEYEDHGEVKVTVNHKIDGQALQFDLPVWNTKQRPGQILLC